MSSLGLPLVVAILVGRLEHRPLRQTGLHFSPYKILFYFQALLWESMILLLSPPHFHLQSLPYYNTIAVVHPFRNIRPRTDPPFVCHTPYNIGDGSIVQRQICSCANNERSAFKPLAVLGSQ